MAKVRKFLASNVPPSITSNGGGASAAMRVKRGSAGTLAGSETALCAKVSTGVGATSGGASARVERSLGNAVTVAGNSRA